MKNEPTPPPKPPGRHPNQRGERTRKKFRTFIAADASDQIDKWGAMPGVLSRGDVIDKLVAHALRTSFDPTQPLQPAKQTRARARTYNDE